MFTISLVCSGLAYGIEERHCGDAAGLLLSLRTQGVTDDDLLKAVEGLVHYGAYTIRQACVEQPPR
jgi:hypothetical protein